MSTGGVPFSSLSTLPRGIPQPGYAMDNTSWELLLKEFRTFRPRALTISKRVVICPTVVDAHIVQATPEAAHLYGFDHLEALLGRWQSHLQHPEDLKCARKMAALRHYGYTEIPTDYVL